MTGRSFFRSSQSGQRKRRANIRHATHRLRLETLEDRRLLAAVIVDTNTDLSNDGDVSTIAALLLNKGTDGHVSLREAIAAANNTVGTDVIHFDTAGAFATPQTITLAGTQLQISDSVTIDGPGSPDLSLDAVGLSRVFFVDDGVATYSDVTIKDVTITGGRSNEGGGIQSFENLSLDNVVVSHNRVLGSNADGGGIGQGNELRFGGSLAIHNSQIVDNLAEGDASAIDFYNSVNLTITNSEIARNHSIDQFNDNSVTFGAIRGIDTIASATGATMVFFENVTVEENTILTGFGDAVGAGASFVDGAPLNHRMVVEIRDSAISGNAQQSGSQFSNGGGLSLRYLNSFTLANSTIGGNRAFGRGGGIAAIATDTLQIVDSTISGNSVGSSGMALEKGGGIYNLGSRLLTITNSTISGNSSNGDGGGIYSAGNNTFRMVTIANSTISGNSARTRAGGIYGYYTCLTIANSTISGNSAAASGGIRSSIDPYVCNPLTVNNTVVAGNRSGFGAPSDIESHTSPLLSAYNLIGDAGTSSGLTNGVNGNIVGVDWTTVLVNDGTDPILADNGGLTHTIALLAGSPAIDAGDPAAVAGVGTVPLYDQRGMPYDRVRNGDGTLTARIDIGAFESGPLLPACDFDSNGTCDLVDLDRLIAEIAAGTHNSAFDVTGDNLVNLVDRDAWLVEAGGINLGPGRVFRLGDANLDAVVDGSDFGIWNAHKFTSGARWTRGDFSADGVVDGSDFGLWNANKFTSSDLGLRVLVTAPELLWVKSLCENPVGSHIHHRGRGHGEGPSGSRTSAKYARAFRAYGVDVEPLAVEM